MSDNDRNFHCPICGNQSLCELVFIKGVPVHCNLLWPTRAAALASSVGDIALVYCPSCGHVANSAFDAALTEYTQAYENSLHFSPRFQAFAQALAVDLVERHNLRQRDLVEIGAGQGDFLRLLCDLGQNRGLGFDEAYAPEGQEEADERFRIIAEFDWQEHIENVPDMIYARHVLEHIEKPADFVSVIRAAIGDAADTLVYLEVPNMAYTLRELAIWDIIYEHCGYFTPQSLACLMTRNGFEVLQTRELFGGQFLAIEALPATASEDGCAGSESLAEMDSQVDTFADQFRAKVSYWQEQIKMWRAEDKRVVAWGAGSKGVTFLNTLDTQDVIPYIVDINPRKLGMFVVGSGQEIVAPAFMSSYRPDIVILMNPLYRDEIASALADMGVTAELVAA
ncbi:MAG: class I SAM-dependent methyltransferase [Candidatus Promineifilaceae bacterium]